MGVLGESYSNRFTTEIHLTGYAAASRYPDFGELGGYGSEIVCLNWTAIGVSIHGNDLSKLIKEGGFNALLKRVKVVSHGVV